MGAMQAMGAMKMQAMGTLMHTRGLAFLVSMRR